MDECKPLGAGTCALKDVTGSTPLHYAARMGRPEVARVLAEANDTRAMVDGSGLTARDLAEEGGFNELVEFLSAPPAAAAAAVAAVAATAAAGAEEVAARPTAYFMHSATAPARPVPISAPDAARRSNCPQVCKRCSQITCELFTTIETENCITYPLSALGIIFLRHNPCTAAHSAHASARRGIFADADGTRAIIVTRAHGVAAKL
jgi:hypothetical protein